MDEILALVEVNRKSLIACNGARISPNAYGSKLSCAGGLMSISPFKFSRTEDVIFKKE